MPETPPGVSPPALVGRAAQLGRLERALADPPALVLVEGEAGIGKSRLVQEFLASRPPRGRVLLGVCPPYREPLTLAPVVDALRQARERVGDLCLSPLAGALRPLFPEWSADLPPMPPPPADPDARRHRLYRALADLIRRLGTDVLVVDDAHWADDVSLEFLFFLAAHPDAARPPSLILTYRPEDVPEGSPLRRLRATPPAGLNLVPVALQPLGMAETAAMVSSMVAGAAVPDPFARLLYEHTDGVPLAVEESVRLLGERAELVSRDGRWVGAVPGVLSVPPTVRDATLERVHRLTPQARAVLQAASVVARPADTATLSAVAGLDPRQGRDGVARAVASGLLRDTGTGTFAFRHVLPATAVHDAIVGPERRRLHLRAGQLLQRHDPPAASELARHFRAAGDRTGWARWAERAADEAVASGDHLAAVALLDDLVADPDLPARVRVRLARRAGTAALFLQSVGSDRATRIVAALRSIVDGAGLDPREQAGIRHLLGRLLNQQGHHTAAMSELARAVPHLDRPVDAARSMVILGWPTAGRWPAAAHLRWLRRVESLPTGEMEPADRLSLRVDLAAALVLLGAERGWRVGAGLPVEVSTAEERLHLARGCLNLGDAATYWGRYAEARRLLERALRLATANQFRRVHQIALATLARLDWLTGAWDGLADRASHLAGDPDAEPAARYEAALVVALVGSVRDSSGAAAERLGHLLEAPGRPAAAVLHLTAAAALARRWLADGRTAQAHAVTARAMRIVTETGIWVWAADIAPVRVDALLRSGERPAAQRLVSAFAAGLRGRDAAAPAAALATCRAMLAADRGDISRARAGYARASHAWDALPRPYDALLARERHAHHLLAAGRAPAARAVLSPAFDRLWALGARRDADRVAHRLRTMGVDVARPWRGGRHGYGDRLSPREQEVLRLAAAGRTNREIAQALSKAPGTVAEQMRSAMRKLGVSTRTAAVVTAIEAGVVEEPGLAAASRSPGREDKDWAV